MTAPTDYAGLQGWWDVSQETYNNNDPVATWVDRSGNARDIVQSTVGLKPLYKTNIFPLGGAALMWDGVDDFMQAPSTLASYISATAYSLFAVLLVDAVDTDVAATYSNDAVICDGAGQFFGLHLRSTGPKAMAYNWDGTEDHSDVTISTGAAFVVHTRHDSGNLIISKDGGTEVSNASGNTTDLTHGIVIGQGVGVTFFSGKIGEMFIYNVARSTGEIAALNTYLTNKWITAAAPSQPLPPLPMRISM